MFSLSLSPIKYNIEFLYSICFILGINYSRYDFKYMGRSVQVIDIYYTMYHNGLDHTDCGIHGGVLEPTTNTYRDTTASNKTLKHVSKDLKEVK